MAEKGRWFQMRVDDRFFELLDRLRKNETDLPSRADMVRRLVEEKIKQISLTKPS
jgi:hypothetical protein